MQFKVFIKNIDSTKLWELPYNTIRVDEELNKDRSATITFFTKVVQNIASITGDTVEGVFSDSYREVVIKDHLDTAIYTGFVSSITFSKSSNDGGSVSVLSKGFFSLLGKRFTNSLRTYSSQDKSDIAWDLIDYTQNLDYGDFGITRGADPTTNNSDRTYRYKSIKEAIEKLSNSEVKDGFDFEIDANKVFNVYYPEKGSYRNNIKLQEGFNIEAYTINKKFIDQIANQVIVFGEGSGEDQLTETRDAEDVYKNIFFLLQDTLSEIDVKTTTTLQQKGDAYLDINKYPQKTISINCYYKNPLWTDFSLGDRLKIEIPSENIDNFMRLKKRSLATNGTVTLYFENL